MRSDGRRWAFPALTAIVLGTLLLLPTRSATAQWASLSNQEDMRGKTIVDVGDLSRETKYEPPPANSNLPGRSITWYHFRGQRTVCANHVTFLGAASNPALLLADDNGHQYLAVLGADLASIKVEVKPFTTIKCPSLN